MTPEDVKSLPDIELDADDQADRMSAAPQARFASQPAGSGARIAATGGRQGRPVMGPPAHLESRHPLTPLIEKVASAPAGALVVRALGELAAASDNAADDRPFAVAVSALSPKHYLGQTALLLACIWGRWDRSVCLIDLASGKRSIEGAVSSTALTLDDACAKAIDEGRVDGVSTLHPRFPNVGVIRTGQSDPLGLVSSRKFSPLIDALTQTFERIVICAPSLDSNFPFLSLSKSTDRLVLSLVKGKSRGAPLREICEQAMVQGLRPIEAVWYD